MLTLDIYHNYNGKLFCDVFNELIMHASEYAVGEDVEIMHRGINMGVAKIEALRQVPFSRISDVVSFLNMGKPAQVQASILSRKYGGGKTLAPETMLTHLVLAYRWRNMASQEQLMKLWWEEKSA